jgi:hypothetical protein
MAAGSNQRKTTDPLIELRSGRKLLATFSGYWPKVCIFPRLAEPDFLLGAADSVAHRKAVQRFATASRGTIVLNRLQLIGLPFTNSIPKLRKFNFCYGSDKARCAVIIIEEAHLKRRI